MKSYFVACVAALAWSEAVFAQNDQLPKGLQPQGEVQEFTQWNDKAGKHYLVFTNTISEGKATWYGTAYLAKSGTFTQEWQIRDFPKGSNGEVRMLANSFTNVDVDGDGLDETAFVYAVSNKKIEESDHDQAGLDLEVKLMLFSKGKKYPVRALGLKSPDYTGKEVYDPAFDGAPAAFRNLAKLVWAESAILGASNSLHFAALFDGYRMLQRSYQYASGGESFSIVDKNIAELPEIDGFAGLVDYDVVGKSIVYLGQKGLCRYTPATKKNEVLYPLSGEEEAISTFELSPNKKKLAFCTMGTVHILTIDANYNVVGKERIGEQVYYQVASATYIDAPSFSSDTTLEISVMELTNDGDPTGEGTQKTIKLKK